MENKTELRNNTYDESNDSEQPITPIDPDDVELLKMIEIKSSDIKTYNEEEETDDSSKESSDENLS